MEYDGLVVSTPQKKIVSWDDDIPNIWKNIKCSKPPTRYNMEYDVWYSKYHLYYDDYTLIFTSVTYIYNMMNIKCIQILCLKYQTYCQHYITIYKV